MPTPPLQSVKDPATDQNFRAIGDFFAEHGGSEPTGAAGGDLTGTYPNPTIGSEKVVAADIKGEAVEAAKIKAEAVTSGKIASEAVASTKLATSAKELFPQNAVAGTHKCARGNVEVKWTSKGVASAGKSITHGLGTTPTSVQATSGSFAGSYAEVASVGSTTFEVRLVSTTGEIAEGTERTVYWRAES